MATLLDLSFAPSTENATTALYGLLRALRARVTKATVQETLLSHPDYPSILSLSDALTDWQVDNTALQLNTVEQLRELPLPFVAHLKRNGGWYVLVTDLKGDHITYTDSGRGRVTGALTEFEKQWSGVVLLAEADGQSGEPDYATKRTQERLTELRGPVVLIGTLLVFLLAILNVAHNLTAPGWLLLLTKLIGLFVSGLLVAKQLGNKNTLTDRLCGLSAKTNCDDILNSPAAKLWGWLSWTDVGLLYFAGGLLTLLWPGNQSNLSLLHGLALLALPYTVFSVYYQARVARQWCTLCLAVQGVLLAEGTLAATQITGLPNTWQPYAALLMAFLLPTLALILARPLLLSQVKSQQEHGELMKFKRDPNLFRALLLQQSPMPPVPDDLHPVRLGNPDAEHTITMVTNPYCGPCAKVHGELEQLLISNANVKATIIFTCDGASGPETQMAAHTLALAERGEVAVALMNWYEQSAKSYSAWANQHPADTNRPDLMAVAEHHTQWCRAAGITGTPTVYVDGYQLPTAYRLGGIRWLINELEATNTKSVANV